MPSVTPHNGVDMSSAPSHGDGASPDFSKLRDEFRALTSTCGVYDLSTRAKIQLTGSDRVRWLNGMVTNNVRDLEPSHGVYSFLLSPQGHILGDFFAYNRGDRILVDTDRSQLEKVMATFDHYIIMDDVELANVSDRLSSVGIAGPKARDILRTARFAVGELKPLQVEDCTWQETPATVVGGEQERHPSYEVWIAPERARDAAAALQSAGATPVSQEALELYRIALGIPRFGRDIRERDLPQETEQQRALNFNKGCYVGQEIVERIRSRGNVHRKFTGFRIAGSAPAPGTKIQTQGKDVGEITSAAVIPAGKGDRTVALGYIRRESAIPGKEVQTAESTAIVSDLPFGDLLTR
jgi:folate-binding protein YgfZ